MIKSVNLKEKTEAVAEVVNPRSSPYGRHLSFHPLILCLIPAAVLTVSYIYLAFFHGTPFLLFKTIHENGRLSLLETIFFFDHFLGMLPTSVFFSLFCAGTFLLFQRKESTNSPTLGIHIKTLKNRFRLLAIIGVLILVLTFLGSLSQVGWSGTLEFLLQYKERDGISSYGGTWKMLFPSNLTLMFIAVAMPFYLRTLIYRQGYRTKASGAYLIAFALLFFISLSLVFSVDRECFQNQRWLAHSMREIATYPLTVFPLVFGILFFTENRLFPGPADRSQSLHGKWRITTHAYLWPLLAALLIVYQLIALHGTSISKLAQKPSFSAEPLPILYLLFFHYFEHILDYIFISLWSVIIYIFMILRENSGTSSRACKNQAKV
ncbi:MAG: hypothetical protein ACE5OP_10030 [Candidatus Glassbacteria bacterium]